MIEAYG